MRSLRIAVTSNPQPVALRTGADAIEVDGCGLRRAKSAKSAAMIITTPIANQSKPGSSVITPDVGVDVAAVCRFACIASTGCSAGC